MLYEIKDVREDYLNWLEEKDEQDTPENQKEFLIWLDNFTSPKDDYTYPDVYGINW